jgi:hypothetical protein
MYWQVNVLASSRLKPVPRSRANIEITPVCELARKVAVSSNTFSAECNIAFASKLAPHRN